MAFRELLSEWYEKVRLLSSPLRITPLIERDKIDFIRDTLMIHFPKNYFRIKTEEETSLDKMKWLNSLLMAGEHVGSVHALYDISILIKYCHSLPGTFHKEFTSLLKNPRNLRAFLFELAVFRTFDLARIKNTKKCNGIGQELEGTFELLGKEFIFECKQPYIPNLDLIHFVTRITAEFAKNPVSNDAGFIAVVKASKPIGKKHKDVFTNKISSFKKVLAKGKYDGIEYLDTDEYGNLHVSTYTAEQLTRIKEENDFDVLFHIAPTKQINNDGTVRYEGRAAGNFQMKRSGLYEKLKQVLKDERRQHPEEKYPNKVVFIASESIPELQFNLFHQPEMYDEKMLNDLFNKLNLKCIVCFLRKSYLGVHPEIKVDVHYPEGLKSEADFLKYTFESKYA